MADEEQLRILKQDVEAWNKWRKDNPDVDIDLGGAYLGGAKLIGANLREADLCGANLCGVDLTEANLREANLREAKLTGADLTEAYLLGAYLLGADLRGVDLRGADLTKANLRGANLRGAYFTGGVSVLATNFDGATLTRACIEDWNINSNTNLENVICDYIYFKVGQQERRPSDPNKNFKPGELVKLFEKYIETVDLIFKDGIDWAAFLTLFLDLRVEYGEPNVSVQAIEKKSDGAFVIRLNVPSDVDKAEIESKAKQSYETNLQVLEAQYRSELKGLEAHHKDEIISLRKEHNTQILELAKLAASRPITIYKSMFEKNFE